MRRPRQRAAVVKVEADKAARLLPLVRPRKALRRATRSHFFLPGGFARIAVDGGTIPLTRRYPTTFP